ncbi:MAG: glycerol-3-phosphate acyltransferase, partial [Alphaproteobacteria bacterium]
WLRFRGGKGVATLIGILFGLSWLTGILSCASWLVVAAIFRISSLSALVMVLLAPLWLFVTGARDALWLGVLLSLLTLYTHRANIARLLAGREPRIGARQDR